MDRLILSMKCVTFLLRGGFLLMLAAAGWQDFKTRRIHVSIFVISAAAGIVLRILSLFFECLLLARTWEVAKGRELLGNSDFWKSMELLQAWGAAGGREFAGKCIGDTGAAMAIGVLLLVLSAVTGEAIGKGDGWFFAVSGLYLGFGRNLVLLWGSLLLCLAAGGVLFFKGRAEGGGLRNIRLPFLVFAVPIGVLVMLL